MFDPDCDSEHRYVCLLTKNSGAGDMLKNGGAIPEMTVKPHFPRSYKSQLRKSFENSSHGLLSNLKE